MRTEFELTFANQFSRVRALLAAGKPLPFELAAWVEQQLEQVAGEDARLNSRDAWLRRAAEKTDARSTRAKALRILAEEARQARDSAERPAPVDTFEGAVYRARQLAPIPRERHLRDILAIAD